MARRHGIARAAMLGGALTATTAAWGGSAPGVPPASVPMPKPMKAWLYRDAGFTGPAIIVDATQVFMETPWPVRSIRIAGDGKWQMCSDTVFEGQCVMVERNSNSLSLDHKWSARVGSIRAICSTSDRLAQR